MADDNIASQADEIEALASIYGEEWCVVDEASRAYCISVTDESTDISLTLQITMPDEYPSSAPPQYTLCAPWLRGQDRQAIQNVLEDIYIENMGENIIFMWVEKLRELLTEQGDELQLPGDSPQKSVNISEEAANSDDSFVFENMDAAYQDYSDEATAGGNTDPNADMRCPEIFHGEPVFDRRSTFQGHLAKVTEKCQVDLVMASLLENKKIANATHNIIAYRICKTTPRTIYITGCEDDGEIHAGNRVLHLMQMMHAENVLVVISRWYGGIHLGPDRFKHINNCARQLLEEHGFRHDGDDKKKPRSSNKKR